MNEMLLKLDQSPDHLDHPSRGKYPLHHVELIL